MAASKKNYQKKSQKFFSERIRQINQIIGRLEKEVEKAIDTVREQSKRSTKVIMKSFDEIMERVGAGDLRNLAAEKTEELRKDISKLSEDIVNNIRNIDLNLDRSVFTNVRDNVNHVLQRFQETEIVGKAKEKVSDTKNQVLSLLRIPSQSEVDSLSRKVVSLERKLNVVAEQEKKKSAGQAAKRKAVASKRGGVRRARVAAQAESAADQAREASQTTHAAKRKARVRKAS